MFSSPPRYRWPRPNPPLENTPTFGGQLYYAEMLPIRALNTSMLRPIVPMSCPPAISKHPPGGHRFAHRHSQVFSDGTTIVRFRATHVHELAGPFTNLLGLCGQVGVVGLCNVPVDGAEIDGIGDRENAPAANLGKSQKHPNNLIRNQWIRIREIVFDRFILTIPRPHLRGVFSVEKKGTVNQLH